MRSILFAAAAATALGMFSSVAGASFTWTGATNNNWNVDTNWLEDGNPLPGGTYPNAAGAAVIITKNITAATNINLPSPGVTVGSMTIGDPIDLATTANNFAFTIASNTLTFDSGAAGVDATLTKSGFGGSSAARDTISSNVVLNSNLTINATALDNSVANSVLRFSGLISGSGTITKTGNGRVSINSNNVAFTGLTVIQQARIVMEGSSNVTPLADVEIWNQATLQAAAHNVYRSTSNINLPAAAALPNNGANGGFVNGGFNGTDADNDGTIGPPTSGSPILLQKLGSLEGTAQGSQVGGGGRGTFEIGYNNLDKTFSGRMGGRTNIIKVGTGVWTLDGGYNNWQTPTTLNALPVNRNFTVLGGRVELNKTEHVSSVAQGRLNIGDGTQSGAARPEVRLLKSHQIAVQNIDEVAENETTKMTLNSGVFNTFGNDETIGSLVVGGAGLSTIDFGTGDTQLRFGNSASLAWTGTLELLNWSGITAGAGTDQLFFGSDTTGLTTDQLGKISFVNPAGLTPGSYAAKFLATGEVVPAVTAIAGDADGDGDVDLDDQGIWAANFTGSLEAGTGTGTSATGDFDGDKDVDLDDQGIWAANFTGSLAPSGLVAVPEPAALAVVGMGVVGLLARRRRA